jgi:hypothetical protein
MGPAAAGRKATTMLGEQIGEEKGRITGRKVLSTDPPKMEISFEAEGTLLGVANKNLGTYWSQLRPDGTMYGEAQGILMSQDGDAATWKAQGVGKFGKNGAVSYRGALYYQTASTKLKKLNTIATLFEYEVDSEGNTSSKLYEWR